MGCNSLHKPPTNKWDAHPNTILPRRHPRTTLRKRQHTNRAFPRPSESGTEISRSKLECTENPALRCWWISRRRLWSRRAGMCYTWLILEGYQWKSGLGEHRFQPLWKILVKLDFFPQVGVKIRKYLKPPTSNGCILGNQTSDPH